MRFVSDCGRQDAGSEQEVFHHWWQMIMHVPFTQNVRLRSVALKLGPYVCAFSFRRRLARYCGQDAASCAQDVFGSTSTLRTGYPSPMIPNQHKTLHSSKEPRESSSTRFA
jgi:hypothetical protein